MLLFYDRTETSKTEIGQLVEDQLLIGAVRAMAQHLGITENGVRYLMQYGFSQTNQDSIAGAEKKVREEFATEMLDGARGDKLRAAAWGANESVKAMIDAAVEADILARFAKRTASLKDGTLKPAARVRPDDLRSTALDMVQKALDAAGYKASKEKIFELAEQMLTDAKKRVDVQKEYDRRNAVNIKLDLTGLEKKA